MTRLEEMLKSPLWRVEEGHSHSGVYWASLLRYWPFYDIATYICQGQGVDAESAMQALVDRVEQSDEIAKYIERAN